MPQTLAETAGSAFDLRSLHIKSSIQTVKDGVGSAQSSFDSLLEMEAERAQRADALNDHRAKDLSRGKDQDNEESDDESESPRAVEDTQSDKIAQITFFEQDLTQTPDPTGEANLDVQPTATAEIEKVKTSVQIEGNIVPTGSERDVQEALIEPQSAETGIQADATISADPENTSGDPIELSLQLIDGETSSARGYNPFAKPGETVNPSTLAPNKSNAAAIASTAAQPNEKTVPELTSIPETTSRAAPPNPSPPADMFAGLLQQGGQTLGDFALPSGGAASAGQTASSSADVITSAGAPTSTGTLSETGTVTLRAHATPSRPLLPTPDIAAQISKHAEAGINRFQIRLDPPELGRIDVRIEFGDNGQMSAHLSADQQDTLDLLQKDARALEKALQALGLDADEDSLAFSLNQEKERDGQSAQKDTPTTDDIDQSDNMTPDNPLAPLGLAYAENGTLTHINLIV